MKRRASWGARTNAPAWIGLVALAIATGARAASFYDEAFDATMKRYDLPGLAVVVVEDGKVAYVRTAGELEAGSGKPVTDHTLFKIASNTKAMTTALLARLVASGKLDWNAPVAKYVPQFRMHDPWVTRNMRVADLLIHNSGLREGAGDLMLWPEPNRFTRNDIIAGLQYLEPRTSFRSGYAYDNLLYVVAGEVAAAAGGAPFEELVRREVFAPLGLGCRVGAWQRGETPDLAQPHMHKNGRNVPIDVDADAIPAITSAAAGGIRCSLADMLAWARNWLVPDAAQLAWLTAEQRRPLWSAHTPMPLSQHRREWDHSHFYAYGYGWRLTDVDGVWNVSHTGTLSGMYSMLSLLPDRRSGFVLMTNGEGSGARAVLGEVLLKHFTDPARKLSIDEYAEALAKEPQPPEHRAPDTSARRPLKPAEAKSLIGVWRDPWFGAVSICARGDEVRLVAAKSPLMAGRLLDVGGRTLVAWDDERVDAEAWIDFHEDGAHLTLAKVDPQADFSFDYEDLDFTRERPCD